MNLLRGPLARFAGQPEEVWFFFRVAAYAFFIGTVYWFLTYEAAGTALLYGFGFAAGFAMLILGRAARRGPGEPKPGTDGAEVPSVVPDGPFGDESGRIPSPSVAPFATGLGVAVLALGLILGPWLIGVGLLVALLGASQWLLAAQRELAASERTSIVPARPADPAGDGPGSRATAGSSPSTVRPAHR